nr:hypothetical transcript [Hymenolepis microstoma]
MSGDIYEEGLCPSHVSPHEEGEWRAGAWLWAWSWSWSWSWSAEVGEEVQGGRGSGRQDGGGGGLLPPWRNRLARSAVNRKVGGSSPPGGASTAFYHRTRVGDMSAVAAPDGGVWKVAWRQCARRSEGA